MSENESAELSCVAWQPSLERLLAAQAEAARGSQFLHDRAAVIFRRADTSLMLPAIVLGAVTGSASIGSASLFGGWPYASAVVGVAALTVSMLNTLAAYYALGSRGEAHRQAALSWGRLHRLLAVELALPRCQRHPAGPFLKRIRGDVDALSESAPVLPDSVIRVLKTMIPLYPGVQLPVEANGLVRVEVCSEPTEFDVPITPTPTLAVSPHRPVQIGLLV